MKKRSAPRKPQSRKRKSFVQSKLFSYLLGSFFLFVLFVAGYHYRNGLAYYFGFKSDKVNTHKEEKRFTDVRNYQLLSKYDEKVVGIDVSEYQGKINWQEVDSLEDRFPIKFVFIRATMGKDKVDCQFEDNWKNSKATMIRGAYHYYRPNENSIEQAANFITNVKLRKGDLPPVLDIEAMPKEQSIDSLKAGLKRWLKIVDAHYNVKPIIYTNEKFYETFLKEEFCDYPFWIANYNFFKEDMEDDWLMWQFTEKASVPGISGNVDVNIYNGSPNMLKYLTLIN